MKFIHPVLNEEITNMPIDIYFESVGQVSNFLFRKIRRNINYVTSGEIKTHIRFQMELQFKPEIEEYSNFYGIS